MVTMILYGGPRDGEEISIHRDNLKMKPRISFREEGGCKEGGKFTEYALDDENKFVWLPDPDDPKVARGIFVFDDDGNVISEENSIGDALDKLDELDDESEQWKFDK